MYHNYYYALQKIIHTISDAINHLYFSKVFYKKNLDLRYTHKHIITVIVDRYMKINKTPIILHLTGTYRLYIFEFNTLIITIINILFRMFPYVYLCLNIYIYYLRIVYPRVSNYIQPSV